MATKTYSISGMHCASCATLIQGTMREISGITSCEVNLINHTATLDFAGPAFSIDALNKKILPFGYSFLLPSSSQEEMTRTHSYKEAQRDMVISIPLIIFCLFLMGRMLGTEYLGMPEMPETFHYLITKRMLPIITTLFILTIGRKYLKAVWTYIVYRKATMDTLVGIGTGFAYFFSIFVTFFGQYFEQYLDVTRVFYEAVIIVIGFISIGKYMEQRTMSKTGQAIKALVNLQVKKARKLIGNAGSN